LQEHMDLDIRFVNDDGNGDAYWYNYDAYDLASFGGVLPGVGDLIVDPGVSQGLDRQVPGNREVCEVVARYFQPATDPRVPPTAVLVVKRRPGNQQESWALGS
jgi:hypothetical protein